MNKLQEKIGIAISYLPMLILLCILSISIIGPKRIWSILLIIAFSIDFIYNKRYNFFKISREKIYYCSIMLFFFLFYIYYPFEEDTKYTHFLLDKRSFLIVGGFCGFLGLNERHRLSYYLKTIIITAVISILYLIFVRIGFLNFLLSENRASLFTHARIVYLNNHMIFNLYMNLAIISIWYIVAHQYKQLQKWKIFLYIITFLIIYYILSISEGRSGFLMSLFIISFLILKEVWQRKKYLIIIALSGLSVLVYTEISHHQRISEKQIKGEPRLFLWKNAIKVIQENPFLGKGASSAQVAFDNQRASSTDETFKNFWTPYDFVDSHNQYIQTTMEFGLPGLFLLLFIYFYPIILAQNRRKIFALLMIITLAFQSIFDMFITGQFVYLFLLCTFMIILCKDDIRTIETNNYITKS